MNNNLKKYCGDIPIVLFANKVDLVEVNTFDTVKIEELVKKFNFMGYYITSAKTGDGVLKAFNAIIEKLYFKDRQLFSQ